MARRELRVVASEKRVGAVSLVDGVATFEQAAQTTFAPFRRFYDDDIKLVRLLLADGWSNGYLYLADEEK